MTSPIPRKTFYMIRHGQTVDNVERLVSGFGAELSEKGIEQAQSLRLLINEKWKNPSDECYVVTSKMPRARRTTGIAFQGVAPYVDDRLNEHNIGTINRDVTVENLHEYANKAMDPLPTELAEFNGHTIPGVNGQPVKIDYSETSKKHQRRVLKSLREHLDKAPVNQDVVFVSHKLTMAETAKALGVKFDEFKNATLYEFEPVGKSGWKLREYELDKGFVKRTLIEQTNISLPGSGSQHELGR